MCGRTSGHDGPCNGLPRKVCEKIAKLTRQNTIVQEALAELNSIEWRRFMYRAGIVNEGEFADLGVFSPMKFFDDFTKEFKRKLGQV